MKRCTAIMFIGVLTGALAANAQFAGRASNPLSATTVPQSRQIQPAELAQMMKAPGSQRPVVFQVGSFVMFQQAHIPGSVYAGPGSQDAGLGLLEKKVASTPRGKLIVIYCGCCPWNKCPNIGPAYEKLRNLGFTNVKALYIAMNFGDDWLAKGYPTEKGR